MPLEPHRPQVEHGLGTTCGPAPPRWLQAIFPEGPTGAFDHPRANRPATRQVLVRRPRGTGTTVIAHRPPHRLPLRHRAGGVLPLSRQRRDDGAGLPGQQGLQVRAAPGQTLGLRLPQQRVGRVPQILGCA
jgi:hypothetical protein